MLCMLMIVFLFIMSLTLSSLLWASRSLLYYEPHALFIIMSLTLSSLLWASRSLHYYEPHALFFIMSLTLSSLLCVRASCFTTQTLYSYSLQIMLSSNTMNQSTWSFLYFSLHNCSTYSDTLNRFKHFIYASFHNIIDIST